MVVYEPSGLVTWSTRSIRERERFDAWQAMLNESHLRWSLERKGPPEFLGTLEIGLMDDLKVVHCVCDPCEGYRNCREIGLDNSALYGLLLILEGHEEVECRGGYSLLKPGNFLLWDTTIPTRFRLHSPIRKITLFVPHKRMRDAFPNAEMVVGKAFDWQSGLGAVASSMIASLSSQAGTFYGRQGMIAAETALELISACLWSDLPPGSSLPGASVLGRIKEYIENNLDNPDLDPGSLALHFGISVRYLHFLFKSENVSVSNWILQRRLERCRSELARVGKNKNITEIAFRWGFSDSAHFCRAFKKRFGFSPKEYRNKIVS